MTGATAALALACGIAGVVVGAGCSSLVRAAPTDEALWPLRRRCPACQEPRSGFPLVPAVTALATRRRCASCDRLIGVRDPIIEVTCGLLFAGVAARLGPVAELPAFLVFVAALVVLAFVDLEHLLLPNRILYPALFAVAGLLGVASLVHWDAAPAVHAVIGGAAAFTAFFLLNLIYPRGLAFGDVRLAGLIGTALGWFGLRLAVIGFFLSFLFSSVIGIGLIVLRIRRRNEAIPFGPFMALGAVAALLGGHPLVHAVFPR